MRKLLLIALVALAFVLESRLSLMGVRPNLTVLFAYAIGLRYGSSKGLLTGTALGMVADSLSGGIMGPGLLGKATAGYLAGFLRGGMFIWTPLLGFMGVLALTIADGAISYTSTAIFAEPPTDISNALIIILLQGMINSAAGLVLRPGHED
jgi:rod shape-determining protein MreD